MKVSPADPRSIRTRDLLQAAMLQLAAEKTVAALTIGDVTRQAGLHRSTFYLHYSGLPELFEDCARALFAELRGDIYARVRPGVFADLRTWIPCVEAVFLHLEAHEAFYRAMLGRRGDPLFRGLFQEEVSRLILEPVLADDLPASRPAPLDMTLRFFSAGFTEIAAWWLEKGKPLSPRAAAQRVVDDLLPDYQRLIRNGAWA